MPQNDTAHHQLKGEEVKEVDGFPVKAAELFQVMKLFNDYLNKALVSFQMPTR